MDGILESGYDIILWAQQFSPTLDTLSKSITTLGAEQAFLLILPFVFWCVNKRIGVRLSVLLVLSSTINSALKLLFDQPRPAPDRVQVLAEESSPGLPSGHSQNSLVVYGYLAAQVRQPWAWTAATAIVLGVGLSRIYLGVHFPTDVLGGWLIGIALLALYLRFEPDVESALRARPWIQRFMLAVVLPLILFLVKPNEDSAQLMGIFLGTLAGFLLELRWVGFSTVGPVWQRALRFILGGGILIIIWLGLKMILPSDPKNVALVSRLIRYTLVGAWASLGAPWLFVKAGLASREAEVWA
jgi:membrane-associated phospholipid phosphatase/putative flippase GtrA